jgi:hypothetical protein
METVMFTGFTLARLRLERLSSVFTIGGLEIRHGYTRTIPLKTGVSKRKTGAKNGPGEMRPAR